MHIAYFNWRRNHGGNSQDRRRARREVVRKWASEPGRMSSGDVAKVTVDTYGKSYKGRSVTILRKAEEVGYWEVQSERRKSPLVVADEHLEKIEAAVAVAAA